MSSSRRYNVRCREKNLIIRVRVVPVLVSPPVVRLSWGIVYPQRFWGRCSFSDCVNKLTITCYPWHDLSNGDRENASIRARALKRKKVRKRRNLLRICGTRAARARETADARVLRSECGGPTLPQRWARLAITDFVPLVDHFRGGILFLRRDFGNRQVCSLDRKRWKRGTLRPSVYRCWVP